MSVGAKITEIKTTLSGKRQQFDCELLQQDSGTAVIIYRMPKDIYLEDVLLPRDSVSVGYFWESRPYNAYHWIDEHMETLALYFNVGDRTRISRKRIEWRDLAVDVLITPDARCRVLDEDEVPADIEPELRRYITTTRDDLVHQPLSRLAEYDKLSRSLMNRD